MSMTVKPYSKKKWHLVVTDDLNRKEPARYIPTCAETQTCATLNVYWDDDDDEDGGAERHIDEMLYPGQPTMCPLVIFGMEKLSDRNLRDFAKRLRAWLATLEPEQRPEIILVMGGSSYPLALEDALAIQPCDRDTYVANLTPEVAISSEAIRLLEDGRFAPCRVREDALKSLNIKEQDFICVNASVEDNMAVILPRSSIVGKDNKVMPYTDARCFTVEITDLMF